jgi:hypothetical protein
MQFCVWVIKLPKHFSKDVINCSLYILTVQLYIPYKATMIYIICYAVNSSNEVIKVP